jgi:hypothetical protein
MVRIVACKIKDRRSITTIHALLNDPPLLHFLAFFFFSECTETIFFHEWLQIEISNPNFCMLQAALSYINCMCFVFLRALIPKYLA